MVIEGLKLVNFRNYKSLELDFAKNFNIIYGDNAQGKTNILEAIYLCASGRSHRTSKDNELVNVDAPGFIVKLLARNADRTTDIEISLEKDERKRIRINEIPIRKMAELMGNVTAVMFSPENLMLIKEGPAERRRFTDITLSQLKPSYFYDLQQYGKVLQQRNMLLKEIQNRRSLIDTLEIWNNNLVSIGSRIIKQRSEFTKRLDERARRNHYRLTDGKEELAICYSPNINSGCESLEQIEGTFRKTLEKASGLELAKQSTMHGPQRDDYEITLNGMSLKHFGSQGQQRTSVLSMKLSEIDIMKEDTGEFPVLLLDDVMSELDAKRQEFLMENMERLQVFITSTDRGFFKGRESLDTSFYNVVKGSVSRIEEA